MEALDQPSLRLVVIVDSPRVAVRSTSLTLLLDTYHLVDDIVYHAEFHV